MRPKRTSTDSARGSRRVRAATRPADTASGGNGSRALDQTGLTHLVGYAATRASVQLKKTFARHLGPLDLKAVEYSILVVVANNEDVNQKQICETLDVSAPNLAVLIDRLEDRALVQRVRGTTDRRETHVRLTKTGRELHRRALGIAQTMEEEALAVLSPAERRALLDLLLRVGGVGSAPGEARRAAPPTAQSAAGGARQRSSE
jgi:DNA-binding MarR family transcriptional regulator